MLSIAIVVEGRSEAILLRRLLNQGPAVALRFYAAEGRDCLATVGRNILVHDGGPLVVAMDADTFDRAQGESSCRMVEATLRRVSPDDRFGVFAFVPALEVVFFEAPSVLTRRFGSAILSPSVIEKGCVQPSGTQRDILQHMGVAKEAFFRELTVEDLNDLRQGEQASKFISVVEGLTVGVGQ
jgi:hypothetical protein